MDVAHPNVPAPWNQAMARHKGSVFGALGEEAQPSSEQLRSRAAQMGSEDSIPGCVYSNEVWILMNSNDHSHSLDYWIMGVAHK